MAGSVAVPFRPDVGVRTLLYNRVENDTRSPTSVGIANTASATVEVDLEWTKKDGSNFFISKAHEVQIGETELADLRTFPFRYGERLYVTVSGAADVFLYLEEPTSQNAIGSPGL